MKKILALYAYADYNKGDSAICLGAKELLQGLYPDAEVLFANFLETEHDYTKRASDFYYQHDIRTIDIPSRNPTKKEKLLRYLSNNDNKINEFFLENKFDLVISIGGHFLFSKKTNKENEIRNDIRLQHIYMPIIAAKRNKIKTGILCQSIGPIEKQTKTIKSIFKSLDFIITRESTSASVSSKYHDNVYSAIDMAYFMENKWNNIQNVINSKNYVVINLRKVLASGGFEVSQNMYEKQLSYFNSVIDRLLLCDKKVYLISQVTSYDVNDSEVDTVIHKQFKEKYYSKNNNVEVIEELYSERELIKIYSEADCLISTRYHGLIFAILANCKVIGVNLEGIGYKLKGMFSDLNISNSTISLDDINVEDATNKTMDLIASDQFYNKSNYISKNLDIIKKALNN
ncbi:TPA: polysaccharide pyruvyl transferase family protein [Photobacterium damselae]